MLGAEADVDGGIDVAIAAVGPIDTVGVVAVGVGDAIMAGGAAVDVVLVWLGGVACAGVVVSAATAVTASVVGEGMAVLLVGIVDAVVGGWVVASAGVVAIAETGRVLVAGVPLKNSARVGWRREFWLPVPVTMVRTASERGSIWRRKRAGCIEYMMSPVGSSRVRCRSRSGDMWRCIVLQ